MKRSDSLFCILLALLLAFSSCGGSTTVDDDTTSTGEDTSTVTMETELTDGVPELDFGGESFVISTGDRYDFEMDVAEQTGEITSDVIYNRNRLMEERFNVEISSILTANPSNEEHPSYVRTSILADDHAFDMAGIFVYTAGALALENMFTNWANVPYVDLTADWWVHNINDTFTVDGKLYTAVSDLCVTSMQLTYAFLFNQQIATDNNIENLFDVVDEGRWTLDYVQTLTEGLYQDVDGDGEADWDDVYGFITDMGTSLDGYFATSGQQTMIDTGSGLEVQLNSERTYDIFTKVNKLINESAGTCRVYHYLYGQIYTDKYPLFTENHGLLMSTTLISLFDELRDMEVDFGILPYPKYDEEQTTYYSFALDNYSVLCIPTNTKNIEMVGALSEAMAAESKKTVMPAYYEKALQGKYTRDERSAQMLDIIMDGRTFDLSILYNDAVGDLPYLLRKTLINEGNYATEYAASKQKYENGAEELYATLKDMQ